jgi:citrate synthase
VTAPEEVLRQARDWWSTDLVDIAPGRIAVRGYEIQDLVGAVSFAQMIWLMLRGELPTPDQAALLEAALVAGVDHGPHAPSIAVARMAVTCGLPVNGAMASAVNLLDDVHGGAGQQCMQLYRQIHDDLTATGATVADADALAAATGRVLAAWRARGVTHVPGFGHRFHPLDPRAPRLLALVDDAAAHGVVTGAYAAVGRAVTAALAAGRPRPVPMNVDGVTAVVYCELGFEPELGRGIFILSRSVGILAHAWEQIQQGGRIKGPMPKSLPYRYTGRPHREVPAAQAVARTTSSLSSPI